MAVPNLQQQALPCRSIRRHFPWPTATSKVSSTQEEEDEDESTAAVPTSFTSSMEETSTLNLNININTRKPNPSSQQAPAAAHEGRRKKLLAAGIWILRFRSAVAAALRQQRDGRLGHRVVGTLFGHRRGSVNFVLQREHNSSPVFFVELATPITALVSEMASGGLVRIALECSKNDIIGTSREAVPSNSSTTRQLQLQLLEEPVWKAYCNGKQCGFAKRKEMGPRETKILKAVEPISMGAGILAGFNGSGAGAHGELMYMRAKFERVVGSRDSEAFYMMNPDSNGAPELSVYLLRV
ncbi:hypothetical protein Dimus_005111 [Dionaea muscipula]